VNTDVGHIRVLVVDDVDVVVAPLVELLNAADGIEVVGTAQDGAEAVSLVRELDPDVVLMDIRMPGMDGIKATRAIRREGFGPRILMLTAYDDESLIRESMDAGADGYLVKGTLVADVIRAIRAA
jgi:DNA-binding NarL/FixJ family response regulator